MKRPSPYSSGYSAIALIVAFSMGTFVAGCKSIPGLGKTDVGSPVIQQDADVEWLESLEEAMAQSAQTGRPILADFTGSDWCGYCIKLHNEVFLTPEFEAWAQDHVILLELDYPRNKIQRSETKAQNQRLKDRYGITGYPTVLFLNADGDVIGNKMGYQRGGPSRWISDAESNLQ